MFAFCFDFGKDFVFFFARAEIIDPTIGFWKEF